VRCRLAYGPADATATATHSLAPVKSRLVLPFWHRFTQVVLEKRPLNGCSSPGKRAFEWVCVCSIVDMAVLKKSMPSRERVKLSSNPNNMAEKTAEHFRNKRNIDYIQFAMLHYFCSDCRFQPHDCVIVMLH